MRESIEQNKGLSGPKGVLWRSTAEFLRRGLGLRRSYPVLLPTRPPIQVDFHMLGQSSA